MFMFCMAWGLYGWGGVKKTPKQIGYFSDWLGWQTTGFKSNACDILFECDICVEHKMQPYINVIEHIWVNHFIFFRNFRSLSSFLLTANHSGRSNWLIKFTCSNYKCIYSALGLWNRVFISSVASFVCINYRSRSNLCCSVGYFWIIR